MSIKCDIVRELLAPVQTYLYHGCERMVRMGNDLLQRVYLVMIKIAPIREARSTGLNFVD
jgi:hypothetical protein